MTRRLLNLLTVLSLPLCVAVVALWVRSYFRTDDFGIVFVAKSAEYRRDRQLGIATDRAGVRWEVTTYEFNSEESIATAELTHGRGTTVWRNVVNESADDN